MLGCGVVRSGGTAGLADLRSEGRRPVLREAWASRRPWGLDEAYSDFGVIGVQQRVQCLETGATTYIFELFFK